MDQHYTKSGKKNLLPKFCSIKTKIQSIQTEKKISPCSITHT